MDDQEIKAMASANDAVKNLAEDERVRVIQWLAAKYMNEFPISRRGNSTDMYPKLIEDEDKEEEVEDEPKFGSFPEMLDGSTATTAVNRALVAAYWVQTVEHNESWKSFELNKHLKDTGNFDDHISDSLGLLRNSKPTKVIQLTKSTTDKGKGHRVMKLTSHGIKEAEKLLQIGQ